VSRYSAKNFTTINLAKDKKAQFVEEAKKAYGKNIGLANFFEVDSLLLDAFKNINEFKEIAKVIEDYVF
jgi:hypothetical protein